ncbi:putative uncharacterized protein involved in ubiquinone biosynthesis [Novosphingobium nitrogenifigens DSM 19370]|uniref:Ubiquinone biosynthesis protein COQ4 n=1 Tax=Novosphingobium nitrogenifigens DSM 19370 TaxID=983920 RepID=F1Z8W0_9SPHN|nr:Coq4 family protein [Novosphingobium nitrogenifigens]EGD58879.1 putative uncharacterized protein involved in ubiquinone biosynthesis [Novosphingobium nitrogenifigens DSM 19370]
MTAATDLPFADLPLFDDRRPVLRMRPGKALHHFRRLLKDKERTEEVFPIFEALPWSGMRGAATRFLLSPQGRYLSGREPFLPALLDDHAALRRMAPGSLAHAYCDFMESEGLTAQGLADEFAKFAKGKPPFHDRFQWYLNRVRDVHDLLHVLTGYGRDALGEACVLAFTYGQQPSPAHLFIGYMAAFNIRKTVASPAPVLRAVREAHKSGQGCPRLCEQAIGDLLPLPIEDVRRRLKIAPPMQYRRAHAIWKGMGIDPYNLLGRDLSGGDSGALPQAA